MPDHEQLFQTLVKNVEFAVYIPNVTAKELNQSLAKLPSNMVDKARKLNLCFILHEAPTSADAQKMMIHDLANEIIEDRNCHLKQYFTSNFTNDSSEINIKETIALLRTYFLISYLSLDRFLLEKRALSIEERYSKGYSEWLLKTQGSKY